MNMGNTTQKPFISKFLIIVCVLLWFVGFAYNTGFGEDHNIFDTAKKITIAVFAFFVIFLNKKYHFTIESLLVAAIVAFIIMANEIRQEESIQDYVWVWLLIPIMKPFGVEKSQMKWIGYIYGGLSTVVLLIGNVTDIFSGWDGNSVSMVQFFSYTVFISIFADIKNKKNIRNMVIFSLVYFYLLVVFKSRSAILFSAIMLLCMLSVIPFRRMLNKSLILIMLIAPLIITIVVVSINELPLTESLNEWSLETFNKLIFNGRDILWEKGLETWRESFLIGNGDLEYERYHNSAIIMLVATGSIGYILLIGVCYTILTRALKWTDDSVVYGLTTSFLMIWMQQSLELGMISAKPNVIPYMILGLIYARITTLEGRKNDTLVYNNSGVQHGEISS